MLNALSVTKNGRNTFSITIFENTILSMVAPSQDCILKPSRQSRNTQLLTAMLRISANDSGPNRTAAQLELITQLVMTKSRLGLFG